MIDMNLQTSRSFFATALLKNRQKGSTGGGFVIKQLTA